MVVDLGLVEWIAGIAATAPGEWAAAERHRENALRQAEDFTYRVTARRRRWYASRLPVSAVGLREL
jgi:hypothetical protein